ncbi:PH domain-containing protein [Gracilimonas sp.]|uniref:PH domain-containing protein n=1 Tax=Gracilimonas sp. TaxID=1974203 RepID=UPI0028722297|nr:PH domain-containing protein [Gracilimonas sp.]
MSDFRKQHPVAGISQVIDTIKQNFITLIILLFIGSTNSEGYFLYFLLAGLGISLVGGIFGWWFFRYRVFEDELQIEKGIFVKKKIYMSKDRIQMIDITEGLLQRLFGLVKLEVKTAGGGTESATISAITREEAEELRVELRKTRNGAVEGEEIAKGEEEAQEKVLGEWKLPSKDLVYAAFTSGNFGLIASILGAISGQLGELINEETIEYIYELMPGFNNVTIYIFLILGIIIISWFLSFLGVIFNYTDFHLKKTEDELIISRGLIEKKQITVPFDRIQAVRFEEGVLRQPFGFGMIYVESAGFDQTQQGRSIVLAPFISASKFKPFLNEFLAEYSEPEYTVRPPKKAFYRYLRRPNYFLIFLIPIVWYLLTYGWMSLLLIPLLSALGWLRYKDAAIGMDQEVLRMRYRTISRTTAIAKRNRIQNAELTENPFQRRKGLKNVSFTVASGAGGMQFEVKDLDQTDGMKIYSWLSESDSGKPEVMNYKNK